jgi:hypothetical protein
MFIGSERNDLTQYIRLRCIRQISRVKLTKIETSNITGQQAGS